MSRWHILLCKPDDHWRVRFVKANGAVVESKKKLKTMVEALEHSFEIRDRLEQKKKEQEAKHV